MKIETFYTKYEIFFIKNSIYVMKHFSKTDEVVYLEKRTYFNNNIRYYLVCDTSGGDFYTIYYLKRSAYIDRFRISENLANKLLCEVFVHGKKKIRKQFKKN